jgi:large subunit ribosomal protein L21
MYAIVEIKGKQYKVEKGSYIDVDLIGDIKEGERYSDYKVLFVKKDGDTIVGTPYVEGVEIEFVKEKDVKGKKLVVFKYKRRKNYKRKKGHRQKYTRLVVKELKTA